VKLSKITLFTAVLMLSTCFVGTVGAANTTTPPSLPQESSEEGGNSLPDVVSGFKDAIISVLMDLVTGLAKTLNSVLTRVLVSYPDVTQSRVLDLHQDVFQVAVALSSVAALWIGTLHLFDRIDGLRPLVSLLVALGFGAVAPSLLYYPVEISRLTTEALAPADGNIIEVSRFTAETLLVLWFDVFLLLGTALIFVVRDVYLMVGVALAPLIGLMAVTPTFRRYADVLISIWIGCLLIGPVNAVVLDFSLSLMGSSLLAIPHYIWGLGALALLFGLPLILLGAGAVFFAPMTRVVRGGANKLSSGVTQGGSRVRRTPSEEEFEEWESRSPQRNRFRRRDWGDD
jgi:hypothetical protein